MSLGVVHKRESDYVAGGLDRELLPPVFATVEVVRGLVAACPPMERALISPVEQRTAPLKDATLPSVGRPRVSSP